MRQTNNCIGVTASLCLLTGLAGAQPVPQSIEPTAAIIGSDGKLVAAVAMAVKVGIPVGPELIVPTASGISLSRLGPLTFCLADATANYSNPCKISPASLATNPTVKAPISGYKLVQSGNGSLVPTPVTGANRLLEVHTPSNTKIQPKLIIATSAVAQ